MLITPIQHWASLRWCLVWVFTQHWASLRCQICCKPPQLSSRSSFSLLVFLLIFFLSRSYSFIASLKEKSKNKSFFRYLPQFLVKVCELRMVWMKEFRNVKGDDGFALPADSLGLVRKLSCSDTSVCEEIAQYHLLSLRSLLSLLFSQDFSI